MQTRNAGGAEKFVPTGEPDLKSVLSRTGTWLAIVDENHDYVSEERIAGVPKQMMHDYALAAVRHARVIKIEDELYFAEIVGFEGVWGEGSNPEIAEADLLAAIPGWAELKKAAGDVLPDVEGFSINLPLAG